MKYLCLIYTEESRLGTLSPEAYRAVEQECLGYEEELRDQGQLLAVEALEPIQAATTVRVRNGRVSVTDGPFAETKEQLAGFYLIDARDLNDAVRVAGRIPPARFGSIEVRPVRALGGSSGEPGVADASPARAATRTGVDFAGSRSTTG